MKKSLLILTAASLATLLVACGGNSAPAGASDVAGSSTPSQASSAADGYSGDFGYSNLTSALQEQGKVKAKAKYSKTYADGATGSDSVDFAWELDHVALGDVQMNNGTVTADFTAQLVSESTGMYVEEHQRIGATLQSDGAGNYTFIDAHIIECGIPRMAKALYPFSTDVVFEQTDERYTTIVYNCPPEIYEAKKDTLLFNDSITAKMGQFGSYEISVPVTRDNIKSLELIPSKNDVAIHGSEFEFSCRLKATLHNDVVVYRSFSAKSQKSTWHLTGAPFTQPTDNVENL